MQTSMNKLFFTIINCFLMLVNVTAKSRIVDVKIFYEPLACDSKNFIVNQLTPTFRVMSHKISLHMYPFGKAKIYQDMSGKRLFVCANGDNECKANLLSTCVIGTLKEPGLYLPFVYCLSMSEVPEESGEKCAHLLGQRWGLIEDCISTCQGSDYVVDMAKITESLHPKPSFMPWLVFDNTYNVKRMKRSFKDFFMEMCRLTNKNCTDGKPAFHRIYCGDEELTYAPKDNPESDSKYVNSFEKSSHESVTGSSNVSSNVTTPLSKMKKVPVGSKSIKKHISSGISKKHHWHYKHDN